MFGLSFGEPLILLLVPLVLLLPKQSWRLLRMLALALFIIALAQPQYGRESERLALLIDSSDSVGTAAAEALNTLNLELESQPSRFYFASDAAQSRRETVPDVLDTSQTDLARALQIAVVSGAKRALLVSDGAESLGSARLALPQLPVDVLYVPSQANVRLSELITPDEVSPGETVEVVAVIESDVETTATLQPSLAGTDLEAVEQTLRPGRNAVAFRFQAGAASNLDLSVGLTTPLEQPTGDDNKNASIAVAGRAPVLVVGDPGLAELLRTQGFEVADGGAEAVTAPLNYSAVVLRESAGAFTTGQLELLGSYVQNGGGLMMTGGPDSFGFGAWYRTAVEDVLPVNTDLRTEVELPLVGLVIVMDRSQSMSTGNPSKLDLAKEGAISVVDLAYQDDLLGLIVFSDANSTEWIFEPRPATEQGKREMLANILNIQTQGGTVLRPAYEQAIAALQEADAAIKHVIILSDGKLYDGGTAFGAGGQDVDFNVIAQAALQANITTSTIAVGEGADFERLGAIADSGGGRYYEALDVSTLPQIFTNEALTATRSLLREESFAPELRPHPLAPEGADAPPTIDAYIATTLKPGAETILTGLQGEPVLAVTRQGLGRTAALTTDVNGWAGELADWPKLPGLVGTVVRWLQARPATYAATVERQGTKLRVVVDAVEDGAYVDGKMLNARVGGVTETLEQVAPGRYEGYLPATAGGDTLLVVDGDDIVARESVDVSSAEFETQGGAELLTLIAERTGGQVIEAGTTYAPVIPDEKSPLWPYLTLVGLGLFVLELLLRRIVVPRSERLAGAGD